MLSAETSQPVTVTVTDGADTITGDIGDDRLDGRSQSCSNDNAVGTAAQPMLE